MSQTTLAVLEQIKALSEEERHELLIALQEPEFGGVDVEAGLDLVYQALEWRYEGEPDASARVDELRR